MIILPSDNQLTQFNQGDSLGELQGSFNLDLTKVIGKTRTTRMIQTTTQSVNGNLNNYPVGFKVFNDGSSTKIWTVTGVSGLGYVHNAVAIPNAVFSLDGSSNTPSDCDSTLSDIEIFGLTTPLLCVTANNKLYIRSTGAWSSTSFTGGGPWMLCSFAGRMYFTVAGANQIYSTIDGTTIISPSGTPNTNAYSFAVDSNQRPTFIRASSNRLWVGTVSTNGGKGYVYEFANGATQYTTNYRLESAGALACVIKDDIPWIIDTNGRLLQYSNGTFVEVARLPIENKLLLSATNTINNRFIHPNGMTIVNGKINILINNVLDDNASSILEFCPSGIWEYDDIIINPYRGGNTGSGLYHKYSLSYLPVLTNTITDYGQNRVAGVGALSEMKLTNNSTAATGDLIAGATVYTDASLTNAGIFINDTFDATSGTTGHFNTAGAGYIVTTKQFAQDEKGNPSIQNTWQTVYIQYEKLITASSKIVVKYRTVSIPPLEASITWTSTTTFTTTTNVLGLEGYEVEGIQGTGSGFCAHISKIDVTSGTYTVTVDDAFTGATGTAKVRIQNWKKISSITQSSATYDQAGIGDLSNWVELKIFMVFSKKDELQKLLISNQNSLPVH